ncbi:MAG: hypothetical protein LQ340_003099 [Diploschistes diacapsis]|nr:MAG: hypothetical protein LQ340_003099 [Diploschistes diacapsis]
MSWFRRLSRDRTSKFEDDYSRDYPEPQQHIRPQSNKENKSFVAQKDSQYNPTLDMMRRSQPEPNHYDQNHYSSSQPQVDRGVNGDAAMDSPMDFAPAPDMLTRAFNEALKPYTERINLMQADIDSANAEINRLESEKAALHNWIDKRGLRPDLPSELSSLIASNSPVAASTLATQLDRKMTMINFSLHHLADSLPTPIPASTVTATLATLLPKITYLSTLPTGPAFAFESLIKLAGNLNSHNSGEETEVDRSTIADFYTDLDDAMVGVVGKRVVAVAEGEDAWEVTRDIRRLEKTAVFLQKEMGVRNYFLRSRETMRGEGSRLNNNNNSSNFATGNGDGMTHYSPESR